MIIRWGRKGLLAGAITAAFVTPVVVTTSYVNEVQARPSHKLEVRHVTPTGVTPTTSYIKRASYRPHERLEFRHVTPTDESEVEEDQEGGGYTPYGLATPWEVDLGGETGAEHLADITQQLESEFGLSPDEIEEVVEQAATTGISLSDGRIRRLAQAIHARPKEFDRIRDMVAGHEDGEDVIALILILAEL